MTGVNLIIIGMAGVVCIGMLVFVVTKRVPRRLRTESFARAWKELQAYCKDKKTWPLALARADKLLDGALKKRKFKGKSMGERMVSAQRVITNNDALWFAHNLTKKVAENPSMRLKEADVKAALLGFRGALKDLGALSTPKPAITESVSDTPEVKP